MKPQITLREAETLETWHIPRVFRAYQLCKDREVLGLQRDFLQL